MAFWRRFNALSLMYATTHNNNCILFWMVNIEKLHYSLEPNRYGCWGRIFIDVGARGLLQPDTQSSYFRHYRDESVG